jgi:exopolysaccharide production protein ExoQ
MLSKLKELIAKIFNDRLFRGFEIIFHFLMLLILTGALIPLIKSANGVEFNDATGDALTQMLLIIGYASIFPYLIFYWKEIIQAIKKSFWVWLLVTLALISVLWSDAAAITLRRGIALLLTSLYALCLVVRYSLIDFVKLLGSVLLGVLLLSLLCVVLLPQYGIMTDPNLAGDWRGVLVHKNILGQICVFSMIAFGYLFVEFKKQRVIWGLGLILTAVLLIGSRSATAWIVACLIVVVTISINVIFRKNWMTWVWFSALFLVTGVLAAFIVFRPELLLGALGKDTTFTGRVQLWQSAIQLGMQKPVLGYGFKAFWLGLNGPSKTVIEQIHWTPPHGHNGYLDLFLELGLIGLIFGVTALTTGLIYSIRALTSSKRWNNELLFLLLIICSLVVMNISENYLLRQNTLPCVLFVQVIYLSRDRFVALSQNEVAGTSGKAKCATDPKNASGDRKI